MMKQLTALMMVCLLVMVSCQKQRELTNGKDISYTEADFLDNEVIDPSADKNGARHSNMKVVIRQVNNAEKTYRLVLKVDSVGADLDGDGVEEMLPLGDNATIQAGLSVPNPFNPDDAVVVFNSTSLTFRKQNENGYYVFVSDQFVSDVNFDYELVQLNYLIGRWKFDDDASQDPSYSKIAGDGQYYILPNGKSVAQAPDVARVKVKGPGRGGAGSSAMFSSMKVTTFDDPTGQVRQVVFKGVVTGLNGNKKDKEVPIDAVLDEAEHNGPLGVSTWATSGCISFLNEDNKWECVDGIEAVYTNLRNANGTIYLLGSNGNTLVSHRTEDLLAGSTDHF